MSVVFNFSMADSKSQEKLKTMLMQNFGGTTKSIMVFLKKGGAKSRRMTYGLFCLQNVTKQGQQSSEASEWIL